MKRKTIGLGAEDFKEIIEDNFYYVDKTAFVEEILERKSKVTLITRPRRFGKTLNMSTLKYFLDIRNSESNRELFRGLKIEKTEYMNEQGKYPVIHITMKEIKGETYEEFMKSFITKVSDIYEEHKYIRDKLDVRNLDEFDKIWRKSETGDYKIAIQMLSKMLYEYYGVKPVILIDEYDAPMMDAYEAGYYERVQKFVGSFYGNALKDGCCSFAVVTGILKIAKESVFSTLNNLDVSTILTGDYNHFGMIEEEVLEILKYYGLETTIKETKEWYNGYLFGDKKIYNPWSITNHCKKGELKAFWIGTSANTLIKNLIRDGDTHMEELFYSLMRGERVKVELDDNMIFEDIYSNSTMLYLMLSAGYLTIDGYGEEDDEYYLVIPNKEVKRYFGKTFVELGTNNRKDSFMLLRDSLIEEDMEKVEKIIQEIFLNTVSYLDLEKREKFYHNIVMAMLGGLDSRFKVSSNRESGHGRYDIALEPKDKKRVGYIFEFKVSKTIKGMDKMGEEALSQIERKLYDTEMRSRGILKIRRIGMVFSGKQLKLYIK